MRLSDFDYELPDELIARFPAPERTASRLLDVTADGGPVDRVFSDLPSLLAPGDLLVLNDTRVVRARLRARKTTGGSAEVLVERVLDDRTALVHLRVSRSPKPGATLLFDGGLRATVDAREENLFQLSLEQSGAATGPDWMDLMASHGEMPLPPYIDRDALTEDDERYQTVYAREAGAVAAPTAGLHFDEPLLDTLRGQGVDVATLTLHVGAGTFATVRDDDLSTHVMHAERVRVSEAVCAQVAQTRARGGRVVAVGTTVVRSLEAAAADGELAPFSGETRLFIQPGFDFRVVDALVTNFHLPRTTLMLLVGAFAGYERIMAAYRHAVAERYRFFSYGDAMFLRRAAPAGRGPVGAAANPEDTRS